MKVCHSGFVAELVVFFGLITSPKFMLNIFCFSTAYCVVAVESVGRQIPIAFLDRVKEDFTKKYGGGKAATAAANSLNREFGYASCLLI